MAQFGDDCYFFYYSSCTKGAACPFRHCPEARGKEITCRHWLMGSCTKPKCEFRHMSLNKDRTQITCWFESQPTGCLKEHCPFKHLKPRPFQAQPGVQQQQQQQPGASPAASTSAPTVASATPSNLVAGSNTPQPAMRRAMPLHSSSDSGVVKTLGETSRPVTVVLPPIDTLSNVVRGEQANSAPSSLNEAERRKHTREARFGKGANVQAAKRRVSMNDSGNDATPPAKRMLINPKGPATRSQIAARPVVGGRSAARQPPNVRSVQRSSPVLQPGLMARPPLFLRPPAAVRPQAPTGFAGVRAQLAATRFAAAQLLVSSRFAGAQLTPAQFAGAQLAPALKQFGQQINAPINRISADEAAKKAEVLKRRQQRFSGPPKLTEPAKEISADKQKSSPVSESSTEKIHVMSFQEIMAQKRKNASQGESKSEPPAKVTCPPARVHRFAKNAAQKKAEAEAAAQKKPELQKKPESQRPTSQQNATISKSNGSAASSNKVIKPVETSTPAKITARPRRISRAASQQAAASKTNSSDVPSGNSPAVSKSPLRTPASEKAASITPDHRESLLGESSVMDDDEFEKALDNFEVDDYLLKTDDDLLLDVESLLK